VISRYFIDIPWVVLLVYWAVRAFKTRQTQTRETVPSRLLIMAMLIVGYVLLFADAAKIGFLHERILMPTWPLAIVGIALTWAGIALCLWARWHLGEYWSARITIKEDHQLIRTGPYARLRHPIYSGFELAALGTAGAIDRWGCLIALLFIVAAYSIKAKKEEKMLAARFGEAFRKHCQRTGFLLPKFG